MDVGLEEITSTSTFFYDFSDFFLFFSWKELYVNERH